jgi:hypothetical protein
LAREGSVAIVGFVSLVGEKNEKDQPENTN